jgi:DNA-binding transcriptional regulator YiaG
MARKKKRLTPAQFRKRQLALGLQNEELGKLLDRTAQTITNWRTGKSPIPMNIDTLLKVIEDA